MLCVCQTPEGCEKMGMCLDELARGAKVTIVGTTASYQKRFSELTPHDLLHVHPFDLDRARAIERKRIGL